jgi:hypothetical protein
MVACVAASPLTATKARPTHTPPAAQFATASPSTPAPRREASACKVGTERISPETGRKQVCK